MGVAVRGEQGSRKTCHGESATWMGGGRRGTGGTAGRAGGGAVRLGLSGRRGQPQSLLVALAPELAACAVEGIREGVEVLVSFIEGDPDRPLISAFLGFPASAATASDLLPSETLEELPLLPDVDSPLLCAIQKGEPLILLCLLPGGGRFSPCTQSICTCRMITGAAP